MLVSIDVAKIESNSLKLNIEKIELNEIINETVKDFINRPFFINKDVKIKFNTSNDNDNNNYPQSELFVYVDKNRIQQVIFNLLDNGSKFTDKGEITLTIESNTDKRRKKRTKRVHAKPSLFKNC